MFQTLHCKANIKSGIIIIIIIIIIGFEHYLRMDTLNLIRGTCYATSFSGGTVEVEYPIHSLAKNMQVPVDTSSDVHS